MACGILHIRIFITVNLVGANVINLWRETPGDHRVSPPILSVWVALAKMTIKDMITELYSPDVENVCSDEIHIFLECGRRSEPADERR